MKKILIVDNDTSALSTLSDGLKLYHELEVVTTESVKLAAKLLNILKIDLVITELNMPEIDGFRLLAYVKKKYPGISVIVITGASTPLIKKQAYALGISGYFEKPVNIEILSESIFQELNIVPEGRIQGISLASFLQLVDMEEKTCSLTIKSKEGIGYVYCLNGDIIAAKNGELRGKEALYKILRWEKIAIEIEDICRVTTREINFPLMHLLMESQTTRDESEFEQQEHTSSNIEAHPLANQKNQEKINSCPNDSMVKPDIDENLFEMRTDELYIQDLYEEYIPKKTTQQNLIQEKNTEVSLNAKLIEILNQISGRYGIFDEKDILMDKNAELSFFPQILPSTYFIIGDKIKELFHIGSLDYITINTSCGIRYCLLKYEQRVIIAALEPGLSPADFREKVLKMSKENS